MVKARSKRRGVGKLCLSTGFSEMQRALLVKQKKLLPRHQLPLPSRNGNSSQLRQEITSSVLESVSKESADLPTDINSKPCEDCGTVEVVEEPMNNVTRCEEHKLHLKEKLYFDCKDRFDELNFISFTKNSSWRRHTVPLNSSPTHHQDTRQHRRDTVAGLMNLFGYINVIPKH